ncbi:long-chain-fatty-acid--CoA ligase [Deinococcus sp.]|uniref:long-chain-fatty-acid--CoA ligase n=1 Tax=Deinococcus sp. TaxID=47478 RepID=UPI0025C5791D|nr:long-chain-fatty-acid--CoA ligase [Deinococcus sp.]
MMDVQLTTQALLPRCLTLFPERPVTSLMVAGKNEAGQPTASRHRTTLGQVARRSAQLAGALQQLGVQPGDRVATLAVNSFYHLEAYLGIPSMGAVIHTLNIRLPIEQLVWILNDSGAKVLLLDSMFLPLLPAFRAQCPELKEVIVFSAQVPEGTHGYDDLISSQPETYAWPELDEKSGAMLCYTSGTTGNPKGVLYTHRSLMLHALASGHPDAFGIGQYDVVLPIVPMFHANAWGTVHTALLYGAGLAFTGVFNDGPSVARTLQDEKATMCAGVVTVMLALLEELDRAAAAGQPYDVSALNKIGCGGTAVPEVLIRALYERHGLQMMQAWGMTETSPLATCSNVPAGIDPVSDEGFAHRSKQGRVVPFIEVALLDDHGQPVTHDGATMGRLLVRGPWIAGEYYKRGVTSDFVELDGKKWLDTGDIATISASGEVWVQDRAKDLVKSGGEWISSAEVENALMAHPGVSAAVVVAVPHPKWTERPLALFIPHGDAPSPAELREYLKGHIAKWWIPDDFLAVSELPIGATGKFLKREIREQYKNHVWTDGGMK